MTYSLDCRWFLVTGRPFGADEAETLALQALNEADAGEAFRWALNPDAYGPNAPFKDEDEREARGVNVWLDSIFDCGTHEPRKVG